MKQTMNYILSLGLVFISSLAYTNPGLLFNISEIGNPLSVNVILSLNGKGPLSRQNYHVTAGTLHITTTVPNHCYPYAGIKVLSPGYEATGCTPYLPTGYCLFTVCDTSAAIIVLKPISGKKNQTISFTSTPPSSGIVGDTYSVTAAASSGLPVTITVDSSSSNNCSISGNTVSFNAVGTCLLNANQAGNAQYNAAPQVQQSIPIILPALTLLSAGADFTSLNPPLLVQSQNRGQSWNVVSIPGITDSGRFNSSTCTNLDQNNTPQICLAAGINFQNGAPLLALSTDAGANWGFPTIPGLTSSGAFYFNSCTGTGTNAICLVTGENLASGAPLLVMTNNGGGTWSIPSIPGLPSTGFFTTNSCTGMGSSAICVACGADLSTGKPLLAQTTDGGNTWSLPLIAGLPNIGSFSSVSCTGSGANAVCLAVGTNLVTHAPLLVSTTNSGTSWTIANVPGLTSKGSLFSASCTGTSSGAVCVAAGADLAQGSPLLVLTTDGTSSWSIPTISGLTNFGLFYTTSCTGSVPATCLVAGEALDTEAPLLAMTTNSGQTWTIPSDSIPGLTSSGALFAINCLQINSSNIICTTSGTDLNSGAPLLLSTLDAGATWSIPSSTMSGLTPFGSFYETDLSRANQNLKKKDFAHQLLNKLFNFSLGGK